MKEKGLNLIDKIGLRIDDFIEYDNKHHCYKWFVMGFSTATVIMQVIVLIIIIRTF